MLIISGLYSLSALYCFASWFNVFRQAPNLSASQRRDSIKILLIATLFWPIVVPISYIEKHTKSQQFTDLTLYTDNSHSITVPNKLIAG